MPDIPDETQFEVNIGRLRLHVLGCQFPDLEDEWDGDWLLVEGRYEPGPSRVRANGAFLRASELASFREQCRALHASLEGLAVLEPMEPNLYVRLEAKSRGTISSVTRLTPEHMAERHEFFDSIDPSILPAILQDLERVLKRFPCRGRG